MTTRPNGIYYSNGDVIRLGDRVEIKRFLRSPLQGVVSYLPGVSNIHPDMEYDNVKYWAVTLHDETVLSWLFHPGTKVKASIRLVSRGEPGSFALKSDDQLK